MPVRPLLLTFHLLTALAIGPSPGSPAQCHLVVMQGASVEVPLFPGPLHWARPAPIPRSKRETTNSPAKPPAMPERIEAVRQLREQGREVIRSPWGNRE